MATGNCLAHGSYDGNGTTQDIYVGFRPTHLHILGHDGSESFATKNTNIPGDDFMAAVSTADYDGLEGPTLTDTGFTVGTDWKVNGSGTVFYWIAWR